LLCKEWKLTEVGEGFFNHRIRSDHFRLDHFSCKITWNVASICLLDSLLLLFQKNHLAAIDQLLQNRTVMILKPWQSIFLWEWMTMTILETMEFLHFMLPCFSWQQLSCRL
jgi:hypothetical protein